MFLAVAVFWLLLDIVSKQVVVHMMDLRQTIPLWDGVFHLTFVRNYGAAFSLMQGQMWLFFGAMVLLIVLVLWFWISERPHHWMPVMGTALVMAGALGNTLDRIMTGSVVDMFDFRVINFAIFNVADIGISVGCAIFLFWLIFLSGQLNWKEVFNRPAFPEPDFAESDLASDCHAESEELEPKSPQKSKPKKQKPKVSLKERMSSKLKGWEEGLDDE